MNYQQTVGAVSRTRWPIDSSLLLIYCGAMTLQGAQKITAECAQDGRRREAPGDTSLRMWRLRNVSGKKDKASPRFSGSAGVNWFSSPA